MFNFTVYGVPQPGGSKKAFFNKKLNRNILVDDCKQNKPWRDSVRAAFIDKYPNATPLFGPIRMEITFFMPRPKGHYGTGKNAGTLKPRAALYHTVKPDATKLVRSTEDALTGYAWVDDAMIALQIVSKLYHMNPHALIRILPMNPEVLETITEGRTYVQ